MLRCPACDARPDGPGTHVPDPWVCACGERLTVAFDPVLPPEPPPTGPGFAAWKGALPIAVPEGLGPGGTPLLREGEGLWAKAEYRNPTGSFKDRGAALVVAAARNAGAERIAADSSGNAALALAALAGRESLTCDLFVPVACPSERKALLRAHGASVTEVEGPRSAVADACREHVAAGAAWDAGHARNPWFLWGTRTLAWELWSGFPERSPDHVFFATGNGTLLLGAAAGFEDLVRAGRWSRLPSLHAVQVEGCAPLRELQRPGTGLGQEAVGPCGAAARGLAIDDPPLGGRILETVDRSGGDLLTVTESEIADALRDLAARGHPPDACSAVCWAAASRSSAIGQRLAVLCGGSPCLP